MSRPWHGAALMSPAHFSRRFRAAYGETPYSYLMTRRIERAKALLRQGVSVTDTCFAVGCTSLGSFSSRFTEIVGETPSQYRARDHRDLEVVPPCVSKVATRPRRAPVPRREQDRRSVLERCSTVVYDSHTSPPRSSPSTIPMRRSASTETRWASRSATTSRPTASAGSPSALPARTSTSSCSSRTAASRRPRATRSWRS